MGNVGKSSYLFHNVYVKSSASVVGKKEFVGPIGECFDKHYEDFYCMEKSHEKAEISMLEDAINICLKKKRVNKDEVNICYSGDLTNQIVSSNYALRDIGIPFFGIFSACATFCEGLISASLYLENNGKYALSCTASHNCTAERQFRYPTEYGTQRVSTYTSTVTGASAVLLSNEKAKEEKSIIIRRATIGKVIDAKFKDVQDMGRAMAPACYHTIKTHLRDFNLSINEYDKIITGDLSYYGSILLRELFNEDGENIDDKHEDCGNIIYDRLTQDVASGGSGCGCIGVVVSSHIINKLLKKEYKKVLICATGALMNPIMTAQKETIPSVCHVVSLEVV